MKSQYAEVFASEKQADMFERISRESSIIPDIIQRQGVEVIVEEISLEFERMDRHTQYQVLADVARGMDYITDENVYQLNVMKENLGKHPETKNGVIVNWSESYFYGVDIEKDRFHISNEPSNLTTIIENPTPENLENGVKSVIGSVMDDIGAQQAGQVYNMPQRFTFEDIASILEES